MEVVAKAKFVRSAPSKINRIVKDLVGLNVDEAMKVLNFLPHKAARLLFKVVKAAKSNAENNYDLDGSKLIISEGFVGQAMMMKRHTTMAKGRAGAIQKKFSHITIKVKEGS